MKFEEIWPRGFRGEVFKGVAGHEDRRRVITIAYPEPLARSECCNTDTIKPKGCDIMFWTKCQTYNSMETKSWFYPKVEGLKQRGGGVLIFFCYSVHTTCTYFFPHLFQWFFLIFVTG